MVIVVAIVSVLAIVGYGYYDTHVKPWHQAIVRVNDETFDMRYFVKMFRLWGADIINMSVAPECILANEAGIPYAAVAMSTDYDCWHLSKETVTTEMILNTMKKNAENVTKILLSAISKISHEECSCKEAIKYALV